MEHIPLVDLKAQHAAVADEVAAGFASVLERTAFVLGDEVDAFEREFAEFSGAPHCVGVGNGTDAVELALRAVGVGDGAEVILPANTFIATAEAVVRAGATPVLVDCDPEFQLIDVDAAVARIGPATGAIVPVHLFGQLAPVDALAARLGADGPLIVEDAAQCQGATHDGAGPATVGVAAATSFYPGKNLGAYGEAGAVLTRDAEVDRRLRSLRNHGSEAKYEHPELGFNSRLDTLQAVVLRAKLARLAAGNAARRSAALRYDTLLGDIAGVSLPATAPGNAHVWHLYVVRVPRSRRRALGVARCRDRRRGPLPDPGAPAGRVPRSRSPARRLPGGRTGRGRDPLPPVVPRDHRAATAACRRRTREGPGVTDRAIETEVFVHPKALCESDQVGARTRVWAFAHVLPGAVIGADCNICDHVFVEGGARVGDRVTVKNAVLIWDGVTVDDDVFLGPNMVFTNDLMPRASVKKDAGELLATHVQRGATIGANATIVCGTTIGEQAFVGAGAVVTRDVGRHALVVGNPARRIGWMCECGTRLGDDLTCGACARTYVVDGAGLAPA